MSVQNWVVMTATEFATARTLDDDENYVIGERPVTNVSPGIGININPDALNFLPAAAVTLIGQYVAPKRMVDDPDCLTYAPDLKAFLLTMPWAMLEAETIFAPEE